MHKLLAHAATGADDNEGRHVCLAGGAECARGVETPSVVSTGEQFEQPSVAL